MATEDDPRLSKSTGTEPWPGPTAADAEYSLSQDLIMWIAELDEVAERKTEAGEPTADAELARETLGELHHQRKQYAERVLQQQRRWLVTRLVDAVATVYRNVLNADLAGDPLSQSAEQRQLIAAFAGLSICPGDEMLAPFALSAEEIRANGRKGGAVEAAKERIGTLGDILAPFLPQQSPSSVEKWRSQARKDPAPSPSENETAERARELIQDPVEAAHAWDAAHLWSSRRER